MPKIHYAQTRFSLKQFQETFSKIITRDVCLYATCKLKIGDVINIEDIAQAQVLAELTREEYERFCKMNNLNPPESFINFYYYRVSLD